MALRRQLQFSDAVLSLLDSKLGDFASGIRLIWVQYASGFMGAHRISLHARGFLLGDCMSIALLLSDTLNNDASVVNISCKGLRGVTRLERQLLDSTEAIQHVSTVVLRCS